MLSKEAAYPLFCFGNSFQKQLTVGAIIEAQKNKAAPKRLRKRLSKPQRRMCYNKGTEKQTAPKRFGNDFQESDDGYVKL